MQRRNNHPILPAIEEFLRIPCKDLALLIDGAWGSGKTFFLRNLFKEEWHGKKIIYISLKGISSLDDISQEISLQIALCKLPEKEKLSKYLSKIPVLSALKNVDIPYLNTSGLVQCLNKGIISGSDLMKYIFIFDDLERLPSHITYKDALFYIHSLLLEGRFANLIVVTDKKHLFESSDSASEEYKQIANKVFYRELPFNQNIKDIFAYYLHTRYPSIPNFLSTSLLSSSMMQEIFEVNATQNLRYYNQFFDAFFAIWPYLDKIKFPSKEIKQNVLNEILVRLWYEYIFLQVTPPSTDAEFMYPFTGFSIFPYEYPFIHQFCVSGVLNEQQLQQEISERLVYYTQRAPINEDLSRLNHFSDYSYNEVCQALNSIQEIYLSLSDIGLLIDIYRCFIFLKHVGLITVTKYQNLVSKLRSRMKYLAFNSKRVDLLKRHTVNHMLYSADKEIHVFWNQLCHAYQKHLENTYVDLFLNADVTSFELLQYCELCTSEQANKFWKQMLLNRNKLAKEGKLVACVRFMLKNLRHAKVNQKDAKSFIETYLIKTQLPSEIELLREWILHFVARWETANYKKYATLLRKRNLTLVRQLNCLKK